MTQMPPRPEDIDQVDGPRGDGPKNQQSYLRAVGDDERQPRQPRFAGDKPWKPWVTYSIIVICVVMLVAQKIYPPLVSYLAFQPASSLLQPYRFITAAFMHGGIIHLLFNMYALYLVGPTLEQLLGRARYIVLYGLAALGGSAAFSAVVVIDPKAWVAVTVGASGAVFGLFAAIVVVFKKIKLPVKSMVVLIGINLILGFVIPNLAWQAHIGGMLVGAVLTALYVRTVKLAKISRIIVDVVVSVAIFAGIVGAVHAAYGYALLRDLPQQTSTQTVALGNVVDRGGVTSTTSA
ncbi:MAG: rhomboid family intramembrane serine protease [Actinomycetaceae bacterium]|nr:rhomboid family intramembrane serine protease [Actinomycetaceae bacterium]